MVVVPGPSGAFAGRVGFRQRARGRRVTWCLAGCGAAGTTWGPERPGGRNDRGTELAGDRNDLGEQWRRAGGERWPAGGGAVAGPGAGPVGGIVGPTG